MKRIKGLPKFLQSSLWYCNLNEMDTKEDKYEIITQVLNYGDWEDLKWLQSVYSDDEIKEVVLHPGRGRWFKDVLNFWELMLKVRIPYAIRERAIFRLDPYWCNPKLKIKIIPDKPRTSSKTSSAK